MAFAIFTLDLAGGARLGVAPLPGRWGDLDADVAAIGQWRADLVLSLTEEAEMARHGAADLAGLLARRGLDHAAFPVADFAVPEPGADWAGLSVRLHRVLDAGGALLCHCFGGQGRSGMVAARLLVERGRTPGAALAALRAVRPGAVETAAQEDWVRGGA